MRTLEDVLRALYNNEINVQITWCWDAGFDLAIGNAYCCGMSAQPEAQTTVRRVEEIAPWLIETAKRLFPSSEFAKEFA